MANLTGTLSGSDTLKASLSVGVVTVNSGVAEKAIADENGDNIVATYEKKSDFITNSELEAMLNI